VIVEEPENHLHPAAQKALGRVFHDVAKDGDKQIVLTTHSELMMEYHDPAYVWVMDRQGNKAKARRLSSVDIYSLWYRLGIDRSLLLQVFGKARQAIVIVEGRDDLQALEPVWIEESLADKVVVARAYGGGWQEIGDKAASLRVAIEHFRLPTRVFVLLDNDGERQEKVDYLKGKHFGGESSHVWTRKELESYLFIPEALASIAGRDVAEAERLVHEVGDGGKEALRQVMVALGIRDTPFHVIMQNALSKGRAVVPGEIFEVVEKVRRLVG